MNYASQNITFEFPDDLFVPIYIKAFAQPHRTKIWMGSRGSGKSRAAAQLKVMRCLEKPPNSFKCLMVRKYFADIRGSVFSTIVSVIRDWGLEEYFTIYGEKAGHPKIYCKLNGNSFHPLGVNESGTTKSGAAKSIENPTDAIIDEADELSKDEYTKFTFSLRGSDDVEEILCFNPPDDEHWLIKYFFPQKSKFEKADGSHDFIESLVKNATILHTTYLDNPFLSEGEIEQFEILKNRDYDTYESVGLGLLKTIRTGGEALPHFDRKRHISTDAKFDPERRVLMCWDFNRRPHHTVGIWQFWHDNDVFRADLVQEFCLWDTSISDVCKSIFSYLVDNEYQLRTIRLIGDFSGTKSAEKGVESFVAKIIRLVEKSGYNCIDETQPNPSVVSSLEFFNDILAGKVNMSDESGIGGTPIILRINPQCSFHIADFEKTKADASGQLVKMTKTEIVTDGSQKKKVTYQVRGHAVDESRYMAVGVFESEYYEYRNKR